MKDPSSKMALLVDAKTASMILAISPRKLWAMTFEETPALPHVRCGRLVRYALTDLQRWIEDNRSVVKNG